MNVKYKGIGRKSVAGLLLCLMGVLTACEDDFGKNGTNSGVLTMKVEVPEGWTSGVAVDEEAPDSRCVSVDAAASESSIPLYLHTIESDNTVAVPSTRGALKESVTNFSMSAICYEEDGVDISELTPNFAYDLTCGVTVGSDGVSTVSCPERLLWPANGRVRFFAFAQDANSSKPFKLSDAKKTGAPTITYTVPEDITTQHDLMAACTDATSANVTLNFRHILTAVKVVTAEDMIPGKITEVTFSGIPNKGTYTPSTDAAKDNWKIDETSTGTYTVQRDVTIGGGYKGPEANKEDIVGTGGGGKELIGATDNLTLLMIPQTLPEGATLTVTFEEALSGKEYTLSADLKDKEWPAGKILTYSISPSSIHIKPVVEFNKKPGVEEDILPYSGVWHDVKVRAYAEVTKDNEVKIVEEQIPEILYSFDGGNRYSSVRFYDSNGINELKPAASTESSNVRTESEIADNKVMCVLQAQEDFKALQGTLNGEFDSNKVINLYEESGNESANCYMLDKPGYYKFPVVYGNSCKGSLNGGNTSAYTITIKQDTDTPGMLYYVDYQGNAINSSNYKPASVADAVLAWQDAPDLIDKVELISGDTGGPAWVKFRVRKHSITQGNALIVVRDAAGVIVWSWHIWVSQHTQDWKTGIKCQDVRPISGSNPNFEFIAGKKYSLADVNLGYCDPHNGNVERKFNIKFNVKVNNSDIVVTKYTAGEETINTTERQFTQAEFKGAVAGDNTYYQWGRSAPTPGGIYNSGTAKYYYKENDYSELNMENKPLFNVYNDGEVSYNFTRNKPGTSIQDLGEETGKTIDWAIRNPHVFIMSKYTSPNYREHWHELLTDGSAALNFPQMWNPKALDEEGSVAKSVYDPCPAGYLVPPADLFSAFAYNKGYAECSTYNTTINTIPYETIISGRDYGWSITIKGGSTFDFPSTGVRNKSLRFAEFGTVHIVESTRADDDFTDNCSLGGGTYPAFRMLTYITSSDYTFNKDTPLESKISIFFIDNRSYTDKVTGKRVTDKSDKSLGRIASDEPGIGSRHPSSPSYGVPVRPMRVPIDN